ncbi:MAG: phosphoribosyltransferase [Candidatus Limnocylindrales bacterium]
MGDRLDAAAKLAEELDGYRGQNVLVLGIPRGGVPVAAEVARRLDAELDIVVARKVGAPNAPELALGAVTANGGRFFNEGIIHDLGVAATYLENTVAREMAEARRREEKFRNGHSPSPIRNRVVLVVDDGLATGATMRAAVRSVRSRHPAKLVVAVPVGSDQACAALRDEVDDLVCLYQPDPFYAVGMYYRNFDPVPDSEVQRILSEAGAGPEISKAAPRASRVHSARG